MLIASILAISLVDVAAYYQGLPHQIQALEILEAQIRANQPQLLSDESEFVETWRNETQTAEVFPQARIIADGQQLQVETQNQTYTINASELSAFILDTYDSETGETVDRTMSGDRFVDVSVNPETGEIAAGVLLDYFAATTTSAVFLIEPQAEGYSVEVAQRSGARPLPNESATYRFSNLSDVRFVSGDLQVTHTDAAGSIGLDVFSSYTTPPLQYAGCVELLTASGTEGLCAD